MGGDDIGVCSAAWAGGFEVVVAADDLPLDDGSDRLDAGFDSAEAAGFGVATAFVSLSLSLLVRI